MRLCVIGKEKAVRRERVEDGIGKEKVNAAQVLTSVTTVIHISILSAPITFLDLHVVSGKGRRETYKAA